MRDRLVELLEEAKLKAHGTLGSMNNGFGAWYADHLIANGVVVPPCKLGDKIYFISIYKKVEEHIVEGICQYPNGLFVKIYYSGNPFTISIDQVFLTKAEAEQKLKEMRVENGNL